MLLVARWSDSVFKNLRVKHLSSELDILADRLHFDKTSVDSDSDVQVTAHLATSPNVCKMFVLTTVMSRNYFRVTRCLDALKVDENVCKEVVLDGLAIWPSIPMLSFVLMSLIRTALTAAHP